jgi:hypothetical protein
MDDTGADEQAHQETRALLARLAAAGDNAYSRAMVDCLMAAHQALHACTSASLLQQLRDELDVLARRCHEEAESLAVRWDTATHAISGAAASDVQAARHIARAACELSALARLKASR